MKQLAHLMLNWIGWLLIKEIMQVRICEWQCLELSQLLKWDVEGAYL
jgi:hypothetical protein